jgi:hypothetical protein
MNRIYLLTLGIVLLCQIHLTTQAQNDSSEYDLGRVKLSKNFTQSITIKAVDLEKMPFANLSEAINVWLYGTYSDATSLLYVIDGNLVSDVNALSIHDIVEITLIQNALIQVNGGIGQQQLVLIRTKRNHFGKSGLTISAQAATVTPDLKTQNAKANQENDAYVNYYHQYYLSAWHNSDKLQFGLSASYQRDVSPVFKSTKLYHYNVTVPPNFSLFKFYGWLSYKLGNKSTLSVGANYAPNRYRLHESVLEPNDFGDTADAKSKESILNTWLQLRTAITKNWKNELNVSYVTGSNKEDETITTGSPATAPYYYVFLEEDKVNMFNLIIRDQFSFEKNFGNWRLAPTLNLMFRYLKADWSYNTAYYYTGYLGGQQYAYAATWGEARYYMITPAFHISNKNSFDWQAGLMYNASKNMGTGHYKRYFPFSSMTLDVLKLNNPNASNSLKIFASISEAGNVSDLNYGLQNLSSNTSSVFYPHQITFINYSSGAPNQYPNFANVTPWMGTAGAILSILNNRLQFSYNFEKRDFLGVIGFNIQGGGGVFYQEYEFNAYLHRLGITAKIVDNSKVRWLTGVNITTIKDKGAPALNPLMYEFTVGDYESASRSWTGGWVNRLQYGNFSAGLDVLYHINEPTISSTSNFQGNKYDKHTLFRLQSLWAGWGFKVPGGKKLEAYVTLRNLFESSDVIYPDTRKFYGLGAKLDL